MSTVAVNFLLLMYPQGPWCLAAATPERDKLEVRTFTKTDLAAQWIDSWNGQRNLYFHVNPPRSQHAAKKLKRTEVLSLNYLHIDIDPSPGEAADGDFRARALGSLKNLPEGIPAPTAIVYSGGGFQAFWKLQEPLALDGSVDQAEDAKLYNVQLEQLLGGDNCHNIDRLMRLPGTWNIPSELKKKKGRTQTEASLISFEDANVYALTSFMKALHHSARAAGASSASGNTPSSSTGDSDVEIGTHPQLASLDELDRWAVPARVKTVLAQGRDIDKPKTGDDSRSAWLYDAICQLIRFGVPDAVIYAVVTDPGWKISESVIDKKGKADAYARRQIEKAHGKAKTGEHSPAAAGASGNGSGNGSGSGGGNAVGGGQPNNGDFQRDRNNIPIALGPAGLYNRRLALSRLGLALKHDVFADRSIICNLDGSNEQAVQDHHVNKIYYDCQEQFNLSVGIDEWHRFVAHEARVNSFHPVLDYLSSVTWDGKSRIEEWLIKYAGVKDTPYTRAVSKLVLIGAVRRVRSPGCRFQEMLVLISPEQGKGKSTAIAALCPNRSWFTDDLPLSADAKTFIERINGKWIIEAAELKGMRNSDVEHLKALLSRERDLARMSYDRIPKEHLRQSIIIGTTNALYFLRDSTGNRRFWPILLGRSIYKEDIIRVRDQLWAEAAQAEAQWEGDIQLPRELWHGDGSAEDEQNSAKLEDPYYEILSTALTDMEGVILSTDVWTILNVAAERRSAQSQHMGEAMRHLGFERDQRRFGNRKLSCYKRGESKQRILVFRAANGTVCVEHENDQTEHRGF